MAKKGKSRQTAEGNSESAVCKKPQVQGTRKTFWCFTLFQYDKDNLEIGIRNRLNEISRKWMYGYEICKTTQRPHLQGYIHLKEAMRMTELRLPGNPHLEWCKGNLLQNVQYCSKEGKTVKGGKWPAEIKIISNLYPWQQSVEALLLKEPDDRKIYWFWESVGNIGKSAFVKYCVVKHRVLFCDGGKKSDIINLVFNNDMDRSRCVIWDIPRASRGSVSYSALEAIKNGLVCNTKYETGVKTFNSPHIIVFANFPPDDPEQLSSDRWIITELLPDTHF